MSLGLSKFSRSFPARVFNRAVDLFLRGYPFAGRGILIDRVAEGWMISLLRGMGWKHPWYTDAYWNEEEGRWEASLLGFVNGYDPLVPGVGANGEDVDLVDGPRIPLRSFRRLGNDQGDEAPEFFQRLGVRKNQNRITDGGEGLVTDDTNREETFKTPQRFLCACDIFISVPRAAMVGSVDVVDESGTSGQVALYRVGYDTSVVSRLGTRARLYATSQFVEFREPSLVDRLLGNVADAAEDTKLISTIFLLSPPQQDGEPNRFWTVYVRHSTFWNLKHATRNARPIEPPAPIRLFTGLLGGLGDSIGNQILSSINEWSDRVSNSLNQSSNAGKFWTV